MQAFDCLSRACPLFGPHLLEASAGTGKTFSIEHIYVRLILEGLEVEQILVMTFTRAATRELKMRIRFNLEKALRAIHSKDPSWDYLSEVPDSAFRNLSDALAGFDQCQIFTIHGFYYRMLKEFAFEAGMGFSLSDPDQEQILPERLEHAVQDFLENGIDENLLCKEQLARSLNDFESVEKLSDKLLRVKETAEADSFAELFAKCKAALHLWPGDRVNADDLLAKFNALAKNFKAEVKGNFEEQIIALANLENPMSLRILLKNRGSLFQFLDPKNKKVKVQGPTDHPFIDWARLHIAPLLKIDVFQVLQGAWHPIAEKILFEEEFLNPDQILLSMKKAMQNEAFAELIRQKYLAAIIDEFQDTDALQWDIFNRLFLEKPLLAFYLVGDPKQSIYRFRKADVYTYLKARDVLGENSIYLLDTNFRSSKPLISALNALFSREWLHLPKKNQILPYHPVKAGAKIDSQFPDEKGAVHFIFAEGEPNILFDEIFLPFAISEIEKLTLKNCALLIKDRYQAERAFRLLQERGIPAVAKSHTTLGDSPAFQAVRELFDAILSPQDKSAAKVVMAGPFASNDISFSDCKLLLEERGLVPLARIFAKELDADMMQIFEMLFAWEKKEGFSFKGLKRYLRVLRDLDEDAGGRRRIDVDDDAVQILTMHKAKGLEFEAVFALGLISRTPEGKGEIEEMDAEKLRQLYVAMTRAKRRLYVPVALCKKEPPPGTHSPMELFCRYLSAEQLKDLAQSESITFEHLDSFSLGARSRKVESVEISCPLQLQSYTPSFLSSFTTLAQTQELPSKWIQNPLDTFTLQTMPRGIETGIAIHKIFEILFSSAKPIWREPQEIDRLVAEQIRFTPLAPWQEEIQQMVRQAVTLPLQLEEEFFSLSELEPNQLQVEMEFFYSTPPHFVKGFIDLIFSYQSKIYFLDWKTNWLEHYDENSLREAIKAHNYDLQATLYAEAIQRHFKGNYGGAFYLFVRGGAYLKI